MPMDKVAKLSAELEAIALRQVVSILTDAVRQRPVYNSEVSLLSQLLGCG